MQVAVTFRHLEPNEGIKDYVKEKVEKLERYLENPREVHVVLTAEKFRHRAEMTVVVDGLTLNSEGRDSDLYTAIDQMVEKVERQARERRGKDKRKGISTKASSGSDSEKAEEFGQEEDRDLLSSIRRRRVSAKPMTVEEALEQLRLSKDELVIFINSDSGQMNVLYRRNDGTLEWVESGTP